MYILFLYSLKNRDLYRYEADFDYLHDCQRYIDEHNEFYKGAGLHCLIVDDEVEVKK